MPNMKDKLIKAMNNYVDSKVLPATYKAMIRVHMKTCQGESAPSRDEWYEMILEEMKAEEANN